MVATGSHQNCNLQEDCRITHQVQKTIGHFLNSVGEFHCLLFHSDLDLVQTIGYFNYVNRVVAGLGVKLGVGEGAPGSL